MCSADAFNNEPISHQLAQSIRHLANTFTEHYDMQQVGGPNDVWPVQRISIRNAERAKNLTRVFVRTKCFLAGYSESPMDKFDLPSGESSEKENVNSIPSPIQSPGSIPNNQLSQEDERARDVLMYQGSILYQSHISQHRKGFKKDQVSAAFSYLQSKGYGHKESMGGAHPSIRFVKVNPHVLQQGEKIKFLVKLTSLNIGIESYTEMYDQPDLKLPSKAKSSNVSTSATWKKVQPDVQITMSRDGNLSVPSSTSTVENSASPPHLNPRRPLAACENNQSFTGPRFKQPDVMVAMSRDVNLSASNSTATDENSASPSYLNPRRPLAAFENNQSFTASRFKIYHSKSDSESDSEEEFQFSSKKQKT